jgi:pimeloyl-ACP methyl ester carboxylesterase
MAVVLSAILVFGSATVAQRPDPGYDARLSRYAYPYPTDTFELTSQLQEHEMVYMDVHPEEANGRTVMLLHGKNFSGAYWAGTIKALSEQGYRVVVPDQLGFGKSTKPQHYQFSFHVLADNTRRLLEHLGVDSTAVVGHSMGGMLATRFTLMYPEVSRKLILVNPIGLEDWKTRVPYRTVGEWYRREYQKTPEKIRAYMTASYFDGEWKEDYDPLVEIQAGWTEGPDYNLIAWVSALTYDMIFTQPVLYEFPDLNTPTLLIIGQRDRTALGKDAVPEPIAETLGRYPELGKRASEAIPDSKLVELDDVGHIPQFEAFERYIEALTQFLSSDR